ncbi:MAG TPA: hypothetical protein VI297_00670 [Gemmatimonadales bacterium]
MPKSTSPGINNSTNPLLTRSQQLGLLLLAAILVVAAVLRVAGWL